MEFILMPPMRYVKTSVMLLKYAVINPLTLMSSLCYCVIYHSGYGRALGG